MPKTWLLLLLTASCAAHSASFDCTKAKTAQEKAICASPELSAADAQMAAAYKNAISATSAAMVAVVRYDQRAWLSQLTTTCPDRNELHIKMAECLKQNYDLRTEALQHLVLHKGDVTFVWRSITLIVPDDPPLESLDIWEKTPGYGTLDVSWPQTNSTTTEWHRWNKAIKEAVRNIASRGKRRSDETWPPEWADNDDGEVTTSIGVVSERLVTAFVEGWWWRGAHPAHSSMQLNWLLREQREMRPDDVFRARSGWNKMIQERCHNALIKELSENIESYHGLSVLPEILHEINLNPENWQLDDKGLTIIF